MDEKKIILIGATGIIGQAICKELEEDCKIIKVGRSSGDFQVDIESSESIIALYSKHKDADAVICVAARGVVFGSIETLTKQQYIDSLQSKTLGQIDLVLQGLNILGDHVSYTLTTGILNRDPIAKGTAAAMVNGAIEAFVKAASIDMPEKQRINAISPTLLKESEEKYKNIFPGYSTVEAKTVAKAYRKCVYGKNNGKIIIINS